MLYFIFGLIAGILLSLSPVFLPEGSTEIYPEWYAGIQFTGPLESYKADSNSLGSANSLDFSKSIDKIQTSGNQKLSDIILKPVLTDSNIYILNGNGELLKKIGIGDSLVSISQNGNYFIIYEKAGTHIELLNSKGERFWRMESREYPYLSSNAEIVLLMNGDQSRIRISDINGNLTGAKEINGRLCTCIAFSGSGYSAIGFLDGSYYLLDEKGEIINSGSIKNKIIKGIAISAKGKKFAVHYGSQESDFVRLTGNNDEDAYELRLTKPHHTRTAMHVTDSGILTVMDYDKIIISQENEIKSIISIPVKSPGLSSIDFSNDVYFAGYTGTDARVHFLVFRKNSSILFHKIMSEESFVDISVRNHSILLTGSHNLYCYSLQISGAL